MRLRREIRETSNPSPSNENPLSCLRLPSVQSWSQRQPDRISVAYGRDTNHARSASTSPVTLAVASTRGIGSLAELPSSAPSRGLQDPQTVAAPVTAESAS